MNAKKTFACNGKGLARHVICRIMPTKPMNISPCNDDFVSGKNRTLLPFGGI